MTSINVTTDFFACRQKDDFVVIEPLKGARKIITKVEAKEEMLSVLDTIRNSPDIKGILILYTEEYPGNAEYKQYLLESLESNMQADKGSYTVTFKSAVIQFLKIIRTSSIPIISGINGDLGPNDFGLILAHDLRIATEKAYFYNPNLELGFPPSALLSFYLSRSLGPAKATEILLTKSKLSSREALDLGLITEVVSEQEFQDKCIERLHDLSTIPSHALIETRQILQPSLDEISKHLDTGLEGFLRSLYKLQN